MRGVLVRAGGSLARSLDRAGVIAEHRLRPTLSLAWPRVLTGVALMSKQTADVAMVGLVLGPPAIAGLAFAYAFWGIVTFLAIGLAGGTIALVSQHYGAERFDRAELAVKASLVLSVAISIPLSAAYVVGAASLIGLLSSDPAAIGYGTAYLAVLAPAAVFEFLNMIVSRTYAAIGDTYTPMIVRVAGGLLNITLNAIFIFGLEMGVVGAALGTGISLAAVTVAFAWGIVGNRYPVIDRPPLPVPVTRSRPHVEGPLTRQLLSISLPLMGRRAAETALIFPLLAIAGTFGTSVVAALEIGRRVRGLIDSLSWGFSIAASTLVGQTLGREDEAEAEAYGREILRFSLSCYVLLAVCVIALANPIAGVFTDDPETLSLAMVFVAVGAVSVLGLGLDGSVTGALRGAGDTRFPFLATVVGMYLVALPVAYAGTLGLGLGVAALYVAMVAETVVPALLNYYRFGTGKWKSVSRGYRETPGD
ncbi:MATE family efflux transporter [Natronorarus salvus]|uniref:MATE family efflux transporter n=1 Tax=Natronorarus salvus TaxID=3117733 RepID=UPI002F266D67